MIFCRFRHDGEDRYGIAENHEVREIAQNPFGPYEILDESFAFGEVELLAPSSPSKIVAVGVNYKAHGEEMNHELPPEPKLFLKPSTAVIGPNDAVIYPKMASRVDYEGELGVVIKSKTKNIEPEQAGEHILGYTCFNDVTARDLQKKDGQWTRGKGFDTFAPIGPWIVSDIDASDLAVETYLNGEMKQSSRTSLMIFKVPYLVSYISKVITLLPGDVIATDTPAGIGPMQVGDQIDVSIEGIGVLRNIIREPAA